MSLFWLGLSLAILHEIFVLACSLPCYPTRDTKLLFQQDIMGIPTEVVGSLPRPTCEGTHQETVFRQY